MNGYWRYPLHNEAIAPLFKAGGWELWWYGFGFGEWAIGFMVRRRGFPEKCEREK